MSKNCYFGIFSCYNGNGRVSRNLVMSGMFTVDDLYNVNIELAQDGVLYEGCGSFDLL